MTIDLSRADFDETEELWIRHGVASFLDIPAQQVKIVSIKDGSVKVVLSLPESSANQLLNCVESDWSRVERTFAPLHIRNIELVPENAEPASARKAIHVALEEIPMAALLRGDQRAWESLYHHIWPLVLRFLKSRGTEPFDAEDIAISVMERLYHMRDRIDSVGLIPHLALAIARHRRTDSYRMALRRQPEGRLRLHLSELVDSIDEPALQGAESVVPSRAIQMSEARGLLEKAMQELDSVTKNIIEERYLGELTSKQIAEKYKMNEHAVRARMARGLKNLREAIASSEELTSELRAILSGSCE